MFKFIRHLFAPRKRAPKSPAARQKAIKVLQQRLQVIRDKRS